MACLRRLVVVLCASQLAAVVLSSEFPEQGPARSDPSIAELKQHVENLEQRLDAQRQLADRRQEVLLGELQKQRELLESSAESLKWMSMQKFAQEVR